MPMKKFQHIRVIHTTMAMKKLQHQSGSHAQTDSVPPTMQSQIPKSRDVTLFFLDMTLYE